MTKKKSSAKQQLTYDPKRVKPFARRKYLQSVQQLSMDQLRSELADTACRLHYAEARLSAATDFSCNEVTMLDLYVPFNTVAQQIDRINVLASELYRFLGRDLPGEVR